MWEKLGVAAILGSGFVDLGKIGNLKTVSEKQRV
jgi:hypothetical protein